MRGDTHESAQDEFRQAESLVGIDHALEPFEIGIVLLGVFPVHRPAH
jgi:hypothetical protein